MKEITPGTVSISVSVLDMTNDAEKFRSEILDLETAISDCKTRKKELEAKLEDAERGIRNHLIDAAKGQQRLD